MEFLVLSEARTLYDASITTVELHRRETQHPNDICRIMEKDTLRLYVGERRERAEISMRSDAIGRRRRDGSVAVVGQPADGGACTRDQGYKRRRREDLRAHSAIESQRVNVYKESRIIARAIRDNNSS